MRSLAVIFALGIFLPFKLIAQKRATTASSKTILQFGAIPNDGKDDTWAFIKAGKYFSNLWDINGVPLKDGAVNFSYATDAARLEIPSGTYNVGKQINVPEKGIVTSYGQVFGYKAATAEIRVPENSAFKRGLELIVLSSPKNNIDGITIIGTGKTRPVIRYNDGLALGYFDSKGKGLSLTDATYSGKWAVTVGNFLTTEHVKNLRVENMEVDGNNRSTVSGGKTIYGGGYGIHGIQMGASGAYLLNTKNTSLKRLSFHDMTLDGLVLQDFYKDPAKFPNQELTNFVMDSCNFNYNRRQGFSWVGGRAVTLKNCTFNFTGSTVDGIATGNPGAGIDIEPEQDHDANLLWCMDGTFTNCQSVDNYGCALLNDVTAYRSRNLRFSNAVFHDVKGYAVWVKGADISFTNCKIWGGFVYGNEGKTISDATKFYNCDFADEEIVGKKGQHNQGFALVESWSASRRMYFTNCTFRVLHPKQRLLAMFSLGETETEFFKFSGCSFTMGENASGNDNVLYGALFDGNTLFKSLNKKENTSISLNGLVVTGSSNASKPYMFSVSGRIMLSPANTNGRQLRQFILGRTDVGTNKNDGYLQFNIGQDACLYTFWGQAIDIGENTVFTNQPGGQLSMLSAIVNNSGKIALEAGSYSAFFYPVSVNTKLKGEFYASPDAKMGLHTAWKNALGSLGSGLGWQDLKLSSRLKVTGANKNIPAARHKE